MYNFYCRQLLPFTLSSSSFRNGTSRPFHDRLRFPFAALNYFHSSHTSLRFASSLHSRVIHFDALLCERLSTAVMFIHLRGFDLPVPQRLLSFSCLSDSLAAYFGHFFFRTFLSRSSALGLKRLSVPLSCLPIIEAFWIAHCGNC